MTTSGRRLLPHTADLIIEAWAPGREECLEQAVHGLVDSFADVGGAPVLEPLPVSFEPAAPPAMLLDVLEEVIYVFEVFERVPVEVALVETEAGGLSGSFEAASRAAVRMTGPAPKAIAWSGLRFSEHAGAWTARATVDV